MHSLLKHPVRRIGISTRSMTGMIPGVGQYESSLERDFMELVKFDKNIQRYVPQPITIQYLDPKGKTRKYTPDGFIEYRRDILPASEMSHVLCEIKYRKDFRANWREFLPKYRAAKKYASEQGWEFHVLTEYEIRTHYLDNVRFLSGYRDAPDMDVVLSISEKLVEMRETDPDALMTTLFRNPWNRAAALPALWYLIGQYQIGCDLSQPLTMRSRIWALENT